MEPAALAVAHAALDQLGQRRADYALYGDYYNGKHRLSFATDKFHNAFGALFRAFADNLCPTVCDAVADRLRVVGFGVEDGAETVAQDAWALWQANRMDQRAGEVHTEALVSGDAYVIVWPDANGQPRLYPNPASLVTAAYDQEQPDVLLWAAKCWQEQDQGKDYIRLTLYWPDRIEKYRLPSKGGGMEPDRAVGFEPYQPEGETWPLVNAWDRVPVFPFCNNARLGQPGRSELRDVLPLQNALNKALADMLVAGEYVALPQRWVAGLEIEYDETTGLPKVPFTPGVERVWTVANEAVRFGEFAPANMAQFLAVQDSFRREIGTVSRTPMHYLIGQTTEYPSGEALKTAEMPFLAKVLDRQQAFGNAWEDCLAFALRIKGIEDARLSTLWNDASPRNMLESVQVAQAKQGLGVSERQTLLELGYSDQQIVQFATEKQDEARRTAILTAEAVMQPVAA